MTATAQQPPTPTKRRRRAPFFVEFYRSDVGKKWVMALTGIVLLGYVLVHMIGNLHLYEGPEQVDGYAEALRDLGGELAPRTLLLWVMRLGLLAAFVLHIHAAFSLAIKNRRMRPVGYRVAAGLHRRQLRVPHDAVERVHRPRLRAVPPRRPHLGQRAGGHR